MYLELWKGKGDFSSSGKKCDHSFCILPLTSRTQLPQNSKNCMRCLTLCITTAYIIDSLTFSIEAGVIIILAGRCGDSGSEMDLPKITQLERAFSQMQLFCCQTMSSFQGSLLGLPPAHPPPLAVPRRTSTPGRNS